ncbi:hypothetical protein BRV35_002552 [Escherichia coli]|nr:hypothetical protein [Escherichia coli]EFG7199937.1 hypothetical protein [Escherichia coli]
MFPAPAGINRAQDQLTAHRFRVPRASGDKPAGFLRVGLQQVCSPRQRG